MAPPFGPFAQGGRPRGPPPFVVQMLRAPLTLNNLIALAITQSVYRSRKTALQQDATAKPCALKVNAVFGMLAILFAISVGHNILTAMRFHRIRRQVFGESMCATRRRWRQQRCGEVVLDDEEQKAHMQKFKEMGERMPSLFISAWDVMLAVGFLGMWLMTTLIAKREGKVELGVAYASIGSLVAFVINMIIGVNGLKFWARKQRKVRESAFEEAQVSDVKEKLLDN